MRLGSVPVLRLLTALYMLASLAYFVAGPASLFDRYFHAARHVKDPFDLDSDSLAITKASTEAQAAGLKKGETIESVDGEPYKGLAQWRAIERGARPDETLTVGARTPAGAHHQVRIRLTASKPLSRPAGTWFIFFVVEIFCFVTMLTAYWVVLAKPRELNAWLISVLLVNPAVLFTPPEWWTGLYEAFLVSWFQTLQIAGPVFVLLIGIYFPERWRFDRRLPWFKWVLIIPCVAGLCLILFGQYSEWYFPRFGPFILAVDPWLNHVINPINLVCVLVYWVAIFDKLRSSSTADARRRMRVLCAGSVVGIGSLLIVFVFLRALAIEPANHPWIEGIGAVLCLVFPASLAYVVVVQRALDVRILLRIGTKYLLARATLVLVQSALVAVILWHLLAHWLANEPLETHDILAPFFALVLTRFAFGKRFQQWLDRKFFREAYTAELVLSDLSHQARTLTETDTLLSTVAKRISDILHVPQISVLLRGGRVFHLQQAVGFDSLGPLMLPESSRTVQNLLRENGPATLYRDNPQGWFATATEDEKRTLDAVNAEVLLPLPGRENLMGLMTLGPKLSEEPYSPADLRLLQSVGTQTGLALEVSDLAHSLAKESAQRERMNREVEIAREVQERLFPQTIPQLPGISLAGACRPALGVGGDYYDFIELEDGRLGLAIGDVSGKGIAAALLMASLRASLRGMMLESPHNLGRLMSNINRLVYEASAVNRYATFFFSIYNPQTHELHYVNAGHNPPILLRTLPSEISDPVRLEASGPVVGLIPNLPYEERFVTLNRGDLLLTFTDGISEAMTANDEEWGEERMIEAARAAANGSASEIVTRLFAAADQFTAHATQHDDMTILVFKLEG